MLLPLRGGAGLPLGSEPDRALAAVPFRARLPVPPVLEGDHIRIPIEAAEQQILPGRKTTLWTFGGSFPGPTVRRRAGRRTQVTFDHQLPPGASSRSLPDWRGERRGEMSQKSERGWSLVRPPG